MPREFNEKLKHNHDVDNISSWESSYIFSHPHYLSPSNDPPFLDINFTDLEVDEMEVLEEQLTNETQIEYMKDVEEFDEKIDGDTHSDIDDEKIDQDEADGKWYFTKEENGTLMRYHIKKILKSIIPREYVSRERSKRHIASVYLPGMEPVPQNHDIVIFHDYTYKDSKNYVHVINISRIEDNNGNRKRSCSSTSNCRFIGKLYEYFDGSVANDLKFTKWLPVGIIISEVEINRDTDGLYHTISPSSQTQLEQLGVTFGTFGLYIEKKKSKRVIRPQNDISDEEYYEIERVESVRYNVKFHYHECLIKFKGYDENENVWLPESSLKNPISVRLKGTSGRLGSIKLGAKDAEASTSCLVQEEPVTLIENRRSPRQEDPPSKRLRLSQCFVPLVRCGNPDTSEQPMECKWMLHEFMLNTLNRSSNFKIGKDSYMRESTEKTYS